MPDLTAVWSENSNLFTLFHGIFLANDKRSFRLYFSAYLCYFKRYTIPILLIFILSKLYPNHKQHPHFLADYNLF